MGGLTAYKPPIIYVHSIDRRRNNVTMPGVNISITVSLERRITLHVSTSREFFPVSWSQSSRARGIESSREP